MKKEQFKDLTWKQIISFCIVILFIFFALGTDINVDFPKEDAEYNEETEIYTRTYSATSISGENKLTVVRTGKTDNHGLWHGKVIERNYFENGELASKVERYYCHGYLHGTQLVYTYKGEQQVDQIRQANYFMGTCVSYSRIKSSNITTDNLTAFDILQTKYPLYIVPFYASGYDSTFLKSYVDTIETEIYKFELDESDFDNTYTLLLDDFEETKYDSIYQLHNEEAFYWGFYYMKMAEFRNAVIDAYRSIETNTFSTIKTLYPNYIQTLNNIYLTDSLFQLFCTDFDSVMMINGPLDPDDPFYTDSIDVRMINSLVTLYAEEESSSLAALRLKSAFSNTNNYDLNYIRELAVPVLEQVISDPVSSPIAELVVYSLAPYYYQGDKIRLAVHEAYNLQKGIISTPVMATVFLDSLSSSNAIIKGNVIENGGAEVTEKGLVWAPHYNPTVNDNMQSSGSGLGEFEVTLSGLSPGTNYYARSYAENSAGLAYGNCVQFTVTEETAIGKMKNPEIDLVVFPNPTDGRFKLRFDNATQGEYQVQLINKLGQVQLEREVYILGNNVEEEFDISHLSKGNYFIKVTNGETINTQKIILQ